VRRDARGHIDGGREPERPGQVVPRPARKDRELRPVRFLDGHEPIDGLVHRPVAADDDHECGATVGRLPSKVRDVTRPLAEDSLAVEARRSRLAGDLGPAATRRAVARRRVDEKDGANGGPP
jgi:hypothetical protein